MPDAKLINSVQSSNLAYSKLFLKKFSAEVEFEDGKSLSFKGNLAIEKDSSIIVSIIKGIEWYRVRLRPDSVEVLDRRKKTVTAGDYKILWDKFLLELDYYTLQNIITNQLFAYPIGDFDKTIKRYKHYCSENHYQLQSVKEGKFSRKYKKEKVSNIIFHQFSILPEIFKISDVYIKDFNANSEIKIAYTDFITKKETLFPSTINLVGTRVNKTVSLKIRFDHIEVDTESSIGFKISDKYKQVNFIP